MIRISRFIAISVLVVSGMVMAFSGAAGAQTSGPRKSPVAVPDALSPQAISTLVSKLDDEQTAALTKLMELLNASADAAAARRTRDQTGVLETLQGSLAAFRESVLSHVRGVPEMIGGIGVGVGSIFAGRDAAGTALFLGISILILAIGAAAEWIVDRGAARQREQIKTAKPQALADTLRSLSLRAVIDVGGLVAFAIAALIAARFLLTEGTDRFLVTSFILYAVLIARFIAALLRFVLAPRRSDLRLVSTDDRTANFIYQNLNHVAAFIGAGLFLVKLLEYNEIPVAGTLRFWGGLLVTVWVIFVTWRARDGVTAILKGGEENPTAGLERMAAWWPMASIVIIALNWFLIQMVSSTGSQALTPGSGAAVLALIVFAPFLDTMIRGIAGHLVPPMEGEGAVAEKAYHETQLSYARIGRIVLVVALVVVIGRLLGVNLRNLTEAGLGAQMAANGVEFLLILAVGYFAWEVTNLWVNRRLARENSAGGTESGGDAGGTGGSRFATILPIVRITLQITIVTLTVLLALSQLGVNIAPLLAGAGIFGLAIGFGAQTLVKDIVSGVFFLLDDAFRIGEYVDVGGTAGSVEKISIRSLQLRATTGPVHVVPYGSISKLTNMSRDWVIMKLKFTVPFDTDLEKVRKIFKKIGQEIMAVPQLAEGMIAPFKSQGAGNVDDVGIVVRGKFTTKPGAQWVVRKEVYARVQKAFEENGIEFARKEVRVRIPGLKEDSELSDNQKRVIAAAASQVADSSQPS